MGSTRDVGNWYGAVAGTEPECLIGPPGAPRSPAIPAEHRPQEDPDDGPAQDVVEREPVA